MTITEQGSALGGLSAEEGPPISPPASASATSVMQGAALWQHRSGQVWQRLRRMRPLPALAHRAARLLSDRAYLTLSHRLYFGRWPNFDAPQRFMEHVQSHMLHCREPLLQTAADKLRVRAHVAAQIGERYLVPSLGDWGDAQAVPLLQLPRPYVIKPTAASGLVHIVRAGQVLDEAGMRRQMARWLRVDYHRLHREWAYQGLKSRLIAEAMLEGDDGQPAPDYKAYVIGGEVRFIQIDRGRFAHHTRNLYSTDWQLLPVRLSLANHALDPRPACLDELLHVARTLAKPFEFLRVDSYVHRGRLLVGELTNYPGAGFERFMPASFDEELNRFWPARPVNR
jgi:hypothetical protein